MKSSCINHPAKDPLIIVREWQLHFCDFNYCAALLLSFFEYWHNIKIESSEKAKQCNNTKESHGDPRTQDETLVQFHTTDQLASGILWFYKEDKIKEALLLLESKGAIQSMRNPNKKYSFDNTKHFIFNPDVVNSYLNSVNTIPHSPEKPLSNTGKNLDGPRKKPGTIPEITPEITKDAFSSKKHHDCSINHASHDSTVVESCAGSTVVEPECSVKLRKVKKEEIVAIQQSNLVMDNKEQAVLVNQPADIVASDKPLTQRERLRKARGDSLQFQPDPALLSGIRAAAAPKPPKVKPEVQEIMEFWANLGLRKFRDSKTNIYRQAVSSLNKLLNGEMFKKVAIDDKYKRAYSKAEILKSIRNFSDAALSPEFEPVKAEFKDKLKGTSIPDFIFNSFSQYEQTRSLFLYYLENKPQITKQLVKPIKANNLQLATRIAHLHMKSTGNLLGDNYSRYDYNHFAEAANRLEEFYNSHKKKGTIVFGDSIYDFADMLYEALIKTWGEGNLRPGNFSSDYAFKYILLPYLYNQGVLRKFEVPRSKPKQSYFHDSDVNIPAVNAV